MKVPTTIVEAVQMLLKFENVNDLKERGPVTYHHTTGRWIRNEWGLWNNESALYKEFTEIGIEHPDDMSGILLGVTYNILVGKPISLIEQVRYYQHYWRQVNKAGKGEEVMITIGGYEVHYD